MLNRLFCVNTVLTGLPLTDPRADLLIQPCSAQRDVTGPHTELSEEKLRGSRLTKSGHSPQSLQSRHDYIDPERKGSREAGLSSDHQTVPPNLADGSCLGSELLRSVSQMSRVEVGIAGEVGGTALILYMTRVSSPWATQETQEGNKMGWLCTWVPLHTDDRGM